MLNGEQQIFLAFIFDLTEQRMVLNAIIEISIYSRKKVFIIDYMALIFFSFFVVWGQSNFLVFNF